MGSWEVVCDRSLLQERRQLDFEKESPYKKFPSLIPEGCRQLGGLSPPCILFFFAFLAGFAADFFLAIVDEGAREGPAGLIGAGANKAHGDCAFRSAHACARAYHRLLGTRPPLCKKLRDLAAETVGVFAQILENNTPLVSGQDFQDFTGISRIFKNIPKGFSRRASRADLEGGGDPRRRFRDPQLI